MRTDSVKQNKSEVSAGAGSSSELKDAVKHVRKTLHPLQVAAGDKENLVGAGKMLPVVGEKDTKVLSVNSKLSNAANSPKKRPNKALEDKKKTITVQDLTSEDEPSEHYWKALAETRRRALEKTLTENQQLHERLDHLTEENNKYKELLDEAQAIIDTLNEVIAEINNEENSVSEVDDSIRRA